LEVCLAWYWRRQRTKKLQEKFGPEYDHTIQELGDQRQAEHELAARLEHVKKLDIRPLSAEEIDRFTSEWQRHRRHLLMSLQ